MLSNGGLPDIASSAEWLAHRYDPQDDAVHFRRVDQATRAAVPFLTDENIPSSCQSIILPRNDAMVGVKPAPVFFVFHSAYCCSTLLANVFNRRGYFSSLKEPVILNDLVGWRHRGAPPERVAIVLQNVLTLLARPMTANEAVVIKPSNVVNALAAPMLASAPNAGALLLYAPLPLFLGSIASKGLWGRLWVRDLLAKQLRDGIVDLGFTAEDLFLQSDLQVAAVGWLAQHLLFLRLTQRWPERVRTLDSETLLANPADVVSRLCAMMHVSCEPEVALELVRITFGRHAKFGNEFDRSNRIAAQNEAAKAYADELEKVATWAEEIMSRRDIPRALPLPLIPGRGC